MSPAVKNAPSALARDEGREWDRDFPPPLRCDGGVRLTASHREVAFFCACMGVSNASLYTPRRNLQQGFFTPNHMKNASGSRRFRVFRRNALLKVCVLCYKRGRADQDEAYPVSTTGAGRETLTAEDSRQVLPAMVFMDHVVNPGLFGHFTALVALPGRRRSLHGTLVYPRVAAYLNRD